MTSAKSIPNPIVRAALLAAAIGFAVPAAAEEIHQIAVYGEVAPRCWVANPTRINTSAVPSPTGGRAICNQARPVLVSEMRLIGADGTLMARNPVTATRTAPAPLSARTALEIVVTPQL